MNWIFFKGRNSFAACNSCFYISCGKPCTPVKPLFVPTLDYKQSLIKINAKWSLNRVAEKKKGSMHLGTRLSKRDVLQVEGLSGTAEHCTALAAFSGRTWKSAHVSGSASGTVPFFFYIAADHLCIPEKIPKYDIKHQSNK